MLLNRRTLVTFCVFAAAAATSHRATPIAPSGSLCHSPQEAAPTYVHIIARELQKVTSAHRLGLWRGGEQSLVQPGNMG